MKGIINHVKLNNISVVVMVASYNNDQDFNKDEHEENDVFGCELVEIKVKVMDRVKTWIKNQQDNFTCHNGWWQ